MTPRRLHSISEHVLAPSDLPKILTLGGGGVLGIAHIGFYLALEEAGLTDNLDIICGTSIGSLISLGIALNYSPKSIIRKLDSGEIDLRKFKDSVLPDPREYMVHRQRSSHLMTRVDEMTRPIQFLFNAAKGVFTAYQQKGLCKGEYIEEVAKKVIEETLQENHRTELLRLIEQEEKKAHSIVPALNKLKAMVLGESSLTFAGLHQLRLLAPHLHFKDLYITATNMSSRPRPTLVVYSHETMPDMPIETAVHCSMAAPIMYAPVEYAGKLYSDGGLLCNAPYETFKQAERTRHLPILCVTFGAPPLSVAEEKPASLTQFFTRLAYTPLSAQETNRTIEDQKNFFYIETPGVLGFNFNLTFDEQYDELIAPAYEAACSYLLDRYQLQVRQSTPRQALARR